MSAGALLALIFVVLAGLTISAMILCGACKLVGVPSPDLFPAIVICLVVNLADLTVALPVGLILGGGGFTSVENMSQRDLMVLMQRSSPFVALLHPILSAGIFSVMLQDCSFLKGLLVWLAQIVVIVLVVALLIVVAIGMKWIPTGFIL